MNSMKCTHLVPACAVGVAKMTKTTTWPTDIGAHTSPNVPNLGGRAEGTRLELFKYLKSSSAVVSLQVSGGQVFFFFFFFAHC
jgi:hypothetical protein